MLGFVGLLAYIALWDAWALRTRRQPTITAGFHRVRTNRFLLGVSATLWGLATWDLFARGWKKEEQR